MSIKALHCKAMLVQVAQGQRLKFEGHWHQDKQWGLEFRASSAEELEMVDRDDIVSYLAGGVL